MLSEVKHPSDSQRDASLRYSITVISYGPSHRFARLLLDRLGVAEDGLRPIDRRSPARGVGDHAPNLGVEVGRVALVAGAKVEDLAAPARIAAAAAEDLTTLEPADKYQRFGR